MVRELHPRLTRRFLQIAHRIEDAAQRPSARPELADGTRLNLAADYGTEDEQDAVIGWEVIYPTPVWIGTIDMPERRPPAFVLVCRDCGDAEIPFPSAAERGRWASAHTEGTGHTSFRVFEFLPGGAW